MRWHPITSGRLRMLPALYLLVFAFQGPLSGIEWPQYRGPNHDGISPEIIRTNWNAEPPRVVWQRSLDAGLSSMSIAGGRVYTMVRRQVTNEVVVALDAATGAELWARTVDRASYPNGGVGDDDGPRSTPTVDGDYVYAFGSYLKLYCLRVTDGSVVWSRDFAAELGASVIAWQNAASPLLEGNLIYVNCNAGSGGKLLAVDKLTGTNVWRVQSAESMTQSTPIMATIGGVRQVIFLSQRGLMALDPLTGTNLWRQSAYYDTSTASSPVEGNGLVFAGANYSSGSVVTRPVLSGSAFTVQGVWTNRSTSTHWCTPVHWQGHLYAHYGSGSLVFRCMEMATRTNKWSVSPSGRFGYGAVLMVGGNLLISGEDGWLVLAEASPAAFKEIGSYQAFTAGTTKCWNVLAVSNGRIYFRSTLEAVCLDVAPPVEPLPPLRLAGQPPTASGGVFKLRVSAADGGALPTNGLGSAEVLASTNPAVPLSSWATLTLTPVFTNGGYELEDAGATNYAGRYYLLRTP